MRRLFSALVFLATGWVSAQNTIVGYEHWLDELDADGQRTFVPASGTSIALSGINIPVGQLSLGLHRIHFRLRDAGGAWCSVVRRSFYISSGEAVALTSGEYWFDQQDQVRVPFNFSTTEDLNLTIDPVVSGLSLGLHRIHFRIRDDKGQWSAVLSRVVHIQSGDEVKLTLLRYWSDATTSQPTDMTTMAIEPNVAVWDVVDEIGFCNWQQTGETDVYFQLKDDHGQWSSVIQRTIDIDELVTNSPEQPGAIVGNPAPPEGATGITYTVPAMPAAGYYEWTLPTGWVGPNGSTGTFTTTSNSITVTVGSQGDDGFIIVAIGNGCGLGPESTLEVHVSGTGVVSSDDASGLAVYPNPTTGQFTIELDAPADVAVFDAMGRSVFAQHKVTSTRHTLDLGDAAMGVYTVVLYKEKNLIHRVTLIKQ